MVFKVYIGGLPAGTTEAEVEREFTKFGPLATVWVARKPPGFAFVEYSDSRDADDAVRQLDGYNGWRVEHSKGGARRERPYGGGYGDRNGYRGEDKGGYGRDISPPLRRRRSPSYDRARRRSPSYDRARRRSPSYDRARRRSPSPYGLVDRRRRSPSPPFRRSRRSPSPRRRRRSPSPVRRTSSRRRDRSESPAPRRSLSPVRSGSGRSE